MKTQEKQLQAYKFRAECPDDVFGVLRKLKDERRQIRMDMGYEPDVVVELFTVYSLEQIKGVMEQVPDSHVMLETIQPLDKYTGERKGYE